MNELDFNYSISKKRKIWDIVSAVYSIALSIFLVAKEYIANNYGIVFFVGVVLLFFAIISLLLNTLWIPGSILKITVESVIINMPDTKKQTIEWAAVSNVSIGPGYIVFHLNGDQKQRNLRLSDLKYKDVIAVKSKIIELCEFKNIPYNNN